MADRLTQVTLVTTPPPEGSGHSCHILVDKEPHKLQPGEMMYSELHHAWLLGCPNPDCSTDPILHSIANLGGHTITEVNGIITVSPSILCGKCTAHYFVEQNQIRWC